MDEGIQDFQVDSLKNEIEKLRQTVGSSAADDSDATSDDEGALYVDFDEVGDNLSEHSDRRSDKGKITVKRCKVFVCCLFAVYLSSHARIIYAEFCGVWSKRQQTKTATGPK